MRNRIKKDKKSKKSDELETVEVPDEFRAQFKEAEEKVAKYFDLLEWDPSTGRILIGGERYILIRAAAMRIGFPEALARMLDLEGGLNNPYVVKLVYQLAKSLGRSDAKKFHLSMGFDDPIEKLSTGPIHFAYTGWAKVSIKPESHPSPDENYFLIYTHPQSFEADSYILLRGENSHLPICLMNAGYSSGWCSESFGIELDARELTCRAKGDKECLFIMTPTDKLEEKVKEYLSKITED
ncbi:MAG: hypothetical protein KGD59_04935 [Candidatus Heimdallarchaeota archaeon]|nr:hypothetical protein [Candidatus Heimdallarchaeota archaeon]MBY8993873.1 hypothetical protein [Candidatus Heimdallarchaeota archaeon]